MNNIFQLNLHRKWFFWQRSPRFHSFANNSKAVGHRNLKFSHNTQCYPIKLTVCEISDRQVMWKRFYGQKSKIRAAKSHDKYFTAKNQNFWEK